MKLREIVNEPAWKWFADHDASLYSNKSGKEYKDEELEYLLYDEEEKIDGGCGLYLNYNNKPLDKCPVTDEEFNDAFKITSITIRNAGINDLSLIPVSFEKYKLVFQGCTINTLKFPADLSIDELAFEENTKINCGLLSLFKLKDLDYCECTSAGAELRAAFEILNTHVQEGKNVIDCQNVMIDAGLEKWAKL